MCLYGLVTDGHHKLVRWRFVTHAGIDGYSRMVTFLKCSTNNAASTVYDAFISAVHQYGLPSRVRCDQGGENYQVARHMIHHRGAHRRSILVGSSVHNQRIERFWRDMHRCVTQLFYRLFYYMEHEDLLDPINEMHLFALHYIYLQKINIALHQFSQGWNSHGIRTEHGMSPNQLFIRGLLLLRESNLTALDYFNNVNDHYGVDEDDTIEEDNNDEGVTIPRSLIQLSDEQMRELRSRVNAQGDDGNHGITLYQQVLEYIYAISS